jgi:GGDEF domain-containing protein
LEITLLFKKYDSLLKLYLDKIVKKSLKCYNTVAQQGGGQFAILSITIINNILEIIAKNIKFIISNKVKDAVIYSVQLDTTQDISVTDQCSIIL